MTANKIVMRIEEEEFTHDDGIYKWRWIYINGKLKFSFYIKL